jgi:hypothetical protein
MIDKAKFSVEPGVSTEQRPSLPPEVFSRAGEIAQCSVGVAQVIQRALIFRASRAGIELGCHDHRKESAGRVCRPEQAKGTPFHGSDGYMPRGQRGPAPRDRVHLRPADARLKTSSKVARSVSFWRAFRPRVVASPLSTAMHTASELLRAPSAPHSRRTLLSSTIRFCRFNVSLGTVVSMCGLILCSTRGVSSYSRVLS